MAPSGPVAGRLDGSFRDPAGYVFQHHGTIYRQVTPAGIDAYRALHRSGVYDALIADGLLVSHEHIEDTADGGAIIRPEQVPMISYPFEWSISMLRDAALVTLRAQQVALRHGLSLKDASAFNVQFLRGRPVLIDTLSFESRPSGPWRAYRQFCQHFLAPLQLAAARGPEMLRLATLWIDGIPLAMASRLLPARSWLRPASLFHVHLHAAAEQKWASRTSPPARRADNRPTPAGPTASSPALEALTDSLLRAVSAIRVGGGSHWARYYAAGESYTRDTFGQKATVVSGWLEQLRPARVWDLGANTGAFSKAASQAGALAVALEADHACVDTLYRETRTSSLAGVLPLVFDLTTPSPAIGWGNRERMTLEQRGPADLVLALAVMHHLTIANNVPFDALAGYLARLAPRLIIEFVPKTDPMVVRMLATRDDMFPDYTLEAFEHAMGQWFQVDQKTPLDGSGRVLYLLTRR